MSDQDNRPSSDEIVEQFWPYDGPHSSDTVTLAAQVMAGLVQYMDNATKNPQRLSGPALYRVLSSLKVAVYGLDQLLDQLGAVAGALMQDTTLYDDRRDRPGEDTARGVMGALISARFALADHPRRWVEQAAQLAYHLGHDTPSTEDGAR